MSGLFCVICDRSFCRHDAPFYELRPFQPTPVETEAGEAMRTRAVEMLSESYRDLAERSKRYSFSPIEGTVLEATGRALEGLSSMSPVAPLMVSKPGRLLPQF